MIETARLTLRPWALGDLDALYALTESEAMRVHLGPDPPSRGASFDRLMRMTGGWATFGYTTLAVMERETGDLIGNCGLFRVLRELGDDFDGYPEAGWIVAERRWGRGYALEAMTAAQSWFDRTHGRQRCVCMIAPDNIASHAVAARLGYRRFAEREMKGEAVELYERM